MNLCTNHRATGPACQQRAGAGARQFCGRASRGTRRGAWISSSRMANEVAMKVFLAGATGVIGRRLVPLLTRAGHKVFGMARSPGAVMGLRAAGAVPLTADALDRQAVTAAVARAAPDVVVQQLTAIPPRLDIRHFDRDFALTNRLRKEGTDHLLAAARAAGAQRFVAQSFAGWPYARSGGPVKSEEDPLDPDPPPRLRATLEAIRHLESAVAGSETPVGLVLRYGAFYGPGTSISRGGSLVEEISRRRVPIVGDGGGIWSFLHID